VKNNLVVVILTFNSGSIINETITQAKRLTDSVYVVDSGSTDTTVQIATDLGCEVVDRAFTNYSDQRNWAITQVEDRFAWQLHLDADEVLDEEAIAAIKEAMASGSAEAYLIRRRDYFMGKMLKHSGVNPWHLRLFRSGVGKCENRLYDQHFVASKPALRLKGFMHDKNALTLGDWVNRHNRWADSEALEALSNDEPKEGVLNAKLMGDSRERTRYLKGVYYRLPGSLRSIAYFIYRYIFRLGFLDGRVGFYFAIFQALWFRVLVDAKIYEIESNKLQN
jgi:glycosyltransferase involved in cell wall biosynthesis